MCGTGTDATVTKVGMDNELSQAQQTLLVTRGRVAAGLLVGISQQSPGWSSSLPVLDAAVTSVTYKHVHLQGRFI